MTAYRFHSLYGEGGDDDFFSSDFDDSVLRGKLGHMSHIPVLVCWSAKDEYVPTGVDGPALAGRIAEAIGGAAQVAVIDGNHGLHGKEAELAEAVEGFIRSLDPDLM